MEQRTPETNRDFMDQIDQEVCDFVDKHLSDEHIGICDETPHNIGDDGINEISLINENENMIDISINYGEHKLQFNWLKSGSHEVS